LVGAQVGCEGVDGMSLSNRLSLSLSLSLSEARYLLHWLFIEIGAWTSLIF